MMMSDSEICQSYKDAKKKSGQIDILAQLNATDPESIRKILKDNNVLEAKRGPKPKANLRIPEQREVPKMPESAKEAAKAADEAHCLNANDQRKVFGAQQERTIVAMKVREATKQGYAYAHEGDSINLSMPDSKTRRGRIGGQWHRH